MRDAIPGHLKLDTSETALVPPDLRF